MIRYRPEIDGMRTVAVMGVLLFHAGFSGVGGGFVGVDVFFVISGYLITALILKDAGQGRFSVAGFYERRIRRLLPPLVPVFAFTYIGAFALLSVPQFVDYAKSFLATLAFSANWYFLASAGYFDGPSELKPLLHMWSLGVEEQYYLAFPVIPLLLHRYRLRAILPAVWALFAVSFAYAVVLMQLGGANDNAFYNSAARFWELMMGSLLAVSGYRLADKRLCTVAEAAGLALIAGAMVLYDKDVTPFPGVTALAPCLGAALILAAHGEGRLVSPVLKSRVFVGIGKISYALYLWHWPIFVYIRLAFPHAGWQAMGLGILASILLSVASFFWLERPFREKRVLRSRKAAYGFLAFVVVMCAGVTGISFYRPVAYAHERVIAHMRERLMSEEMSRILARFDAVETDYQTHLNLNFNGESTPFNTRDYAGYTCSYDKDNTPERLLECLTGQAVAHNVLILGDSLGRDTYHALTTAFPDTHFLILHASGCPPVEKQISTRYCFRGMNAVIEALAEKVAIDAYIIAFRYTETPDDWRIVEPTLAFLHARSDAVYLMGPTPVFTTAIPAYLRGLPFDAPVPPYILKSDRSMLAWDLDRTRQDVKDMAARHGAHFVDTQDFFCDAEKCRLWLDAQKDQPIYWDKQHMSHEAMAAFALYLRGKSALSPFRTSPVTAAP